VVGVLCLSLSHSSKPSFAPLFPNKTLPSSEVQEIKAFLNHSCIAYKDDKRKGVLIPEDMADQLRGKLIELGIPKKEGGKGFELFDTNTWIKGEKELQVLEMRALKGQLEKDLCAFEHIKSANVILDIPPQKTFSGTKYVPKASVILTLMPGERLTTSELMAVTNHLSGAVRGLEPKMIAISDTSGKLYKGIEPEGMEETFFNATHLFEEHLEEKISDLLMLLVGKHHFFVTVQAQLDRQTDVVLSLSVSVVIDKSILETPLEEEALQKEVERQVVALGSGYGVEVSPVINMIPFEREKVTAAYKKKRWGVSFFLTLLFVPAAFVCALFPFLKKGKKRNGQEELIFPSMTRIDLSKIAHSIKQQDPQTIAMMLSYLQPFQAEQIIAALDNELQERVLFYLSEMEKNHEDH
jgi:flagellar biosynthesis/type III secretory pathway M-ring protein FliF/YscJ